MGIQTDFEILNPSNDSRAMSVFLQKFYIYRTLRKWPSHHDLSLAQ